MQALSLQAIFLFYGIFLFSTALLVAWLFRHDADLSARSWIAGTLLSAVATTSTVWRNELPAWLSYLLPNTLELAHALMYALSLWALTGPMAQLRRWLLGAVLIVTAYGAGLTLLWNYLPKVLVPYVSLGNGLAHLVAAGLLYRHTRGKPEVLYVLRLSQFLGVFGLLWPMRLPVYAMGLGHHAMDPQLANWLNFVGLLVAGIFLQFAYIGLRFSNAYGNRLVLAQTQARLERLLNERSTLVLQQRAPCGALARQIAHELNQPLSAIRLTLEVMTQPGMHANLHADLADVLHDLDRISQCLDNARQLTQMDHPHFAPVPAQAFVDALAVAVPHMLLARAGPLERPLRIDMPLFTAALKTLLEPRVHTPGTTTPSIELQDNRTGHARLRILTTPGVFAQEELEALKGREYTSLTSARAGSRVLDMLTVYHLVRAHAGSLQTSLSDSTPQRLCIDLFLPLVPPTSTEGVVSSPDLSAA